MDVRLVTDGKVEERGVDELQKLLKGEDGFIWVDISTWNDEAVKVLSEVFRFHPLAVKDAMEESTGMFTTSSWISSSVCATW
jgi:Mg2+ and Co2+ transporter CorA